MFLDPEADVDKTLYSRLSELGFRRSGEHLYRPHCKNCKQCIAARIPTAEFAPSRAQKRCWKRNQDLVLEVRQDVSDPEFYELYAEYITARHADGDMYPPSEEQFTSFLTSEWGLTHYFVWRLHDKIACVAVVDRLDNGLSAIYTFFDPKLHDRSLGRFAVLSQVEWARQHELDYVYLGYWIENCDKMRYKSEYRPLDVLHAGCWQSLIPIQNSSD